MVNYLAGNRASGTNAERSIANSYTTSSAFDTTAVVFGAESYLDTIYTRRGIKINTGSSAIGKIIRKVKTEMRIGTGATGSINYKVYRSGNVISTSSTLDVTTFTTSFVSKELLLNTKVILQADDRVVAEYTGGTAGINVFFLYNNNVNTIASGFSHTYWDGSAWGDINYNIMFGFDSTPATYGSNELPNIQNGLEFHETDTNKDYVFSSVTGEWVLIA